MAGVSAPVDATVAHPEMTAAIVCLSHRWPERWPPLPVNFDIPVRATTADQRQHDLRPAATWTIEACPFLKVAILYDNHFIVGQFIV